MAWTFDFGDTFMHYPIAGITTLGKWSVPGASTSAVTIAEDGFQGVKPSDLRKTMSTTTFGRMIWARLIPNSLVNGESGILALLGGAGPVLQFSLGRNENTTGLILYRPNGTSIVSADALALLPAGQIVNVSLCGLLDGVNMQYEVRVNNSVIGDLTGSAAYATTAALNTISPSRGFGSMGVCQSQYAGFRTKTYSGAGGMPVNADWFGNDKRGVQRASADGQYPATQGGARWIPNSGTDYFSRLNETLADSETTMASNIVDPNSLPGAVDRMSVALVDPPAALVNVKNVQRCSLMRMATGSGTVKLFYGVTGVAGDTYDAVDVLPASTYNYTLRQLQVDPRDGAAWNRAKLVNLDLGVELFDLV